MPTSRSSLASSPTPATLNVYAPLFDEAANITRVGNYVNEQFASLAATDN